MLKQYKKGTPDSTDDTWTAVNRENGPVYFFEQTYDQDGNRVPSSRESAFTTHHTEMQHSAQDVCTTWREHTYKTETNDNSAAGSCSLQGMAVIAAIALQIFSCI